MKIEKYLRQEFFKGKSISARLIDEFVGALLVLIAVFAVFWLFKTKLAPSLVAALTLATLFVVVRSWVRKLRFEKFRVKFLSDLADELALEKLSMLNSLDIVRLISPFFKEKTGGVRSKATKTGYIFEGREKILCSALAAHPSGNLTPDDVTAVVREMRKNGLSRAIIVSTAQPSGEAKLLTDRLSLEVEIISGDELAEIIRKLGIFTEESEVSAAIEARIAAHKAQKERLRAKFGLSMTPVRFLMLSAGLAAWYLVAGSSIYFLIAAGVMAVMFGINFAATMMKKSAYRNWQN